MSPNDKFWKPLTATVAEQMSADARRRERLKQLRLEYLRALRSGSDNAAKIASENLAQAMEEEKRLAGVSVPPVPPAAGSGGPGKTTPAPTPKPETKMETNGKKMCGWCEEKRLRADNATGVCKGCGRWLIAWNPRSTKYAAWVAAGRPSRSSGWVPPESPQMRGAKTRAAQANGKPAATKPAPPKPSRIAIPGEGAVPVGKVSPARLHYLVRLGREARAELNRRQVEARRHVREARAALRDLR